MGENMMHNDWCSQCTTGTTETKPEKDNLISWEDCHIHADSMQEMGYRLGLAKGKELAEQKEKIPELILNDPCQPCNEDVECYDCNHRHPELEVKDNRSKKVKH